MEKIGIPVPSLVGYGKISEKQDLSLFDGDLHPVSLDYIKDKKDYFFKDWDGQCASFVRYIEAYSEFEKVLSDFSGYTPEFQGKNKKFVLQTAVHQHPAMSSLNPNSINTIRIITIKTSIGYEVLSAGLRIGNSRTGNVDNWAAGGICVAVNDDGRLYEKGFYKPGYGTTDTKSETGIVFKDFQVPFYKEAMDLACKAHSYLYNIDSIGWDIAITPEGPIFIEGNDNWEISLMQGIMGKGLRKEWLDRQR